MDVRHASHDTSVSAALRRVVASVLFAFGVLLSLGTLNAAQAKYAALVIDADTGEVLHSVNADQRNYPASLTKIMTLYLLFDALDSGRVHLHDEMPVSSHAAGQAPSKLGLRPGSTLEVEQAIEAIVTKSANDVAATIGEYLGGNEPAFAQMMTRKAHELGMRQTQFRNASGLPNLSQYSSARDMATLARAMIRNHAKWYHYFSTREFHYKGIVIPSHNRVVLHYPGADGLKTGYIAASGFNLVTSAKRDGRRLIGVIFGGRTAAARDRHMIALLDAAFARKPGSGIEMASASQQSEEETAQPVAEETSSTAAVMHAMARTKAARDSEKPHHIKLAAAHRKKLVEPTDVGDANDTEEDDGWGIQVGAYTQKARAQAAANAAVHKLGKLVEDGEVKIAGAKRRHHGMIYRARVIGLPEDTAREACRRMARSHKSCAVISASLHVASRE